MHTFGLDSSASKFTTTFRISNLTIKVPKPFIHNGVEFINVNDVIRPTCKFGLPTKDGGFSIISFRRLMELVFTEHMSRLGINKYNLSFVEMVRRSHGDGNFIPFLCRNLQEYINSTCNQLPVFKTMMNSWAVNRRVSFIDPEFDTIVDPNKKLEYQIQKADKYFDNGWSLIGLSDSNLSDRNYIFMDDLRKYTPFGIKHHNPQRNLYQTLGMKGDELPNIRSQSQQKLIDQGIKRTGWNATTAFLDVPMNFEDQILLHRQAWEDRFVKTKKVYTIYGTSIVEEGDHVGYNQVLGINKDQSVEKFDQLGEYSQVASIHKRNVVIDGVSEPAITITVETWRYFKEGFKLTNLHGNKGIIRFYETGDYVIHDPVKGDFTPDVVVSLKSVTKRKNFGQILEALVGRCTNRTPLIIPDEASFTEAELLNILRNNGWDKETSPITTPYGKAEVIWGPVFWGCIKTPEENVWTKRDLEQKNSKGHYVKGLKFSHMEFRALSTIFGTDNPVVSEIISYSRTGEYLKERLKMLDVNKKHNVPTINYKQVKTIDPKNGIFHTKEAFNGTVSDPNFYPDGCNININPIDIKFGDDTITITSVYLPKAIARSYWPHKCGKVATTRLINCINNAIFYMDTDPRLAQLWLNSYYETLVKSLGSKTGEVAQLGMAVRYPKSVKGTAVVSDTLPKNTVEIHTSLAKILGVKTGDPVLVERFPCLGFMSLRPQYIRVTNDEDCRYTIRVSNNSLVSQNLDFDGDTLFIASFKTIQAKEALRSFIKDEHNYTNKLIEKMNAKKKPCFTWGGFDMLGLVEFPKLTIEKHREVVSKAVGVKAHTGPVIATAYNLMRISENYYGIRDQKLASDIEVMLDFLGNTVFSQKHGIKALHDEAIYAVSTGDVDKMASMGFDRGTSEKVITAIKHYAKQLGVYNLKQYHKYILENGGSNIINKIVRTYNKVYFASRAQQNPIDMLQYLRSKPNDIPSFLLHKLITL